MIFGDFRSDLITLLAIPLGTAKATTSVDSGLAEIRAQAKAGAREAIPEIEAKVRRYVVPTLVVSGVAVVLSVAAIIVAKRRRR